MTDAIVVVDSGQVLETTESAIVAKNEADRAEQWAQYAEEKANLSEQSALESAQSRDEAREAAQQAQDTVNAFDANAEQKTQEYNTNAQQKLDTYNSNDAEKTQAFNQNAAEKQAQVDEAAELAQASADKAAQYAESASFGNIGDIKYTTRKDVPNGGAWCDGSEFSKAQFPDIWALITSGKLQTVSMTEYEAQVATYGVCGFIGWDSASEKFKVPLIKDVYIKCGYGAPVFGAESLPNIKGSFGFTDEGGSGIDTYAFSPNNTLLNGAFKRGEINKSGLNASGTSQVNGANIEFDSSLSSPTYRDGAK